MTASELRIGNWVEIKDQEVKTYAQIEGVGNLQQVGGQLWSIEELEPIPLTEEWLERFGFASIVFTVNHSRKVKDDYRKESNGYFVKLSKGLNNPDTFYYFPSNVGKGLPVKYVHSLQNLYFSITGEELELKP